MGRRGKPTRSGDQAAPDADAEKTSFAQNFFAGKSKEEISEWTRVGIETHLRDVGSFSGFAPLEEYFNRDLPLSEGVAAIYFELGPEERGKLRNALALTLDQLPVSEETVPTIKEVLYSARRLPAPEIFHFLPRKIKGLRDGNGELSDVVSNDVGGRSLFDVAFQTLIDMPVEGSHAVLNELIASRHFKNNVSFCGLALDGLCRVDAPNFPAHFEKLRDGILLMFERYETPPRIKKLLAKRIITSIGLELFREKHFELRFEATVQRTNDNWFYEGLFGGDQPILTLNDGMIAWADQSPPTWLRLNQAPQLEGRDARGMSIPEYHRDFPPEPMEDSDFSAIAATLHVLVGAQRSEAAYDG